MVMNFNELKEFYSEHFSIGNINGSEKRSSIENKFILISLICYLYYKNKPKLPDLTYYALVCKLSKGLGLPEEFLRGLAIVCEDFGYGTYGDFPTFGLKGKDILNEIVSIFKCYLPF